MAGVEVTVYYLEMAEPPHRDLPEPRDGLAVVQAKTPTVGFYRFSAQLPQGRVYRLPPGDQASDACERIAISAGRPRLGEWRKPCRLIETSCGWARAPRSSRGGSKSCRKTTKVGAGRPAWPEANG